MEFKLKILILAGKQADEKFIKHLIGNDEAQFLRYAMVSRGVRHLESVKANLVLLVPDPDDNSWERAIKRIQSEHQTWAILLGTEISDMRERVLAAGAYSAYDLAGMDTDSLPRCFSHLERQLKLEATLARERQMADWVEKTGRIGSWITAPEGKDIQWSQGIHRISEDKGRLTKDFSSMRQFIHPEDLDIYDQAYRSTFEQGWSLDFEYRINTGNDKIRHLHLHQRVNHDDEGKSKSVYGMVHDVTPEREFENFLFRRDAILQVVGSMAKRFLSNPAWQSGLNETLAALGKAAEVSRIFIFQKQGRKLDESRYSMTYEWVEDSVKPVIHLPIVQNQTFAPTFDQWTRTMSEQKIVAGHVRNFQKEERDFFKQLTTQSVLLTPVFVGGTWWGFIGLSETREEREWMPGEIESIKMVAGILGSAILRERMENQLKAANRAAEVSRQEAQEASLAKSRFLANMSHEIRTPISGILGMAEMTITTGLTTEQREHMDMIRDGARSLLSIVNDILDISKIEAEKMELKTEDFELRPLIENTLRNFAPVLEKKPLSLNHSVAQAIPNYIHGDPDRLAQILRNLIGNALKFTERGHVDVTVEISERQNDRICLLFTVEDSGEGIPEEMIDTIFDSFTQADSSTRKKHQGTGLGLTISRKLVQMMDGDITVNSRLGLGSSFSFTIWQEVPKQIVKKSVTAESLMPKGMHLNILMAEDNPLNQKFLTHFLSMFGHEVTVAENGIKALQALKKLGQDVDLVLMDIQMPIMGGIEATKAIRSSDGRLFDPSIPIIALTAYAMKGDKERMFAAGMNDYVSKPVDMKELSAAIARAVINHNGPSSTKGAAMPFGQPKQLSDQSPTIQLDIDSLIARFDGNMTLLGEILDLFLDEAESKLTILDQAMADGNMEELGAAIHSITNISSHVLAMDIVDMARELEKRCYSDPLEEVAPDIQKLKPLFLALVDAVREKAPTL
jgi:signal transduction histidine kinase/DNA-binding response OmpR family regulator/PAS domain-containing protein